MSARGADDDARGGQQAARLAPANLADGGVGQAVVSSAQIAGWARELGFGSAGVAGIDLAQAEPGLQEWLAASASARPWRAR